MNRPFVNGNREQTNNFTVDGLDVNETIDNRVSYQPSPDALAEISVETNNYAADTGNVGGAVISNVIKSGANQFRGNVFEFYRNSDFDANTWENNRSGAPRQERKQHIFGGTLGGPILKDKLFFFVDYQGSRQDAPGSTTASVAPEAWRRGDLSSVTTPIRDPVTGLPFPGNQIPVGRFSPTARAILNDTANYPLPNRTVPGGSDRELRRRHPVHDPRPSGGHAPRLERLGRTTSCSPASRSPPTRTNGTSSRSPSSSRPATTSPSTTSGFNWSRVFGPSVINEVLVGFSRTTVTGETFDWAGVGDANATYGIAGGQPIPGLSQIGWGSGAHPAGGHRHRLGHPRQDLPAQREAHLAPGASRLQVRRPVPPLRPAALLRGEQRAARLHHLQRRVHRLRRSRTSCSTRCRARAGGAAIPTTRGPTSRTGSASSCRTTSRSSTSLTVNLGLRWAYTSPLVEKDNRQSNFDLADRPADLRQGREPRGPRALQALLQGLRAAGRLRLERERPPRLPRRLRHLAVHGRHRGQPAAAPQPAALLRVRGQLRPDHRVGADGNRIRRARARDHSERQRPGLRSGPPSPVHPAVERVRGVPADLVHVGARSGYVGHHASHLVTPTEGNQALPGVGDPATWAPKNTRRPLYPVLPLVTTIATTTSRSGSQYNSLQASVRQRSWNGLEFLASYTLGKTRTTTTAASTACSAARAPRESPRPPKGPTGRTPTIRKPNGARRSTTCATTSSSRPPTSCPSARATSGAPSGRGPRNAILGGWKLSGIFQARTGLPITVTDGREPLAAGRARRRAAELHRRSRSVRPVDRALARHQRLPGGAPRDLRQLPGRGRPGSGLRQPRPRARRRASSWAARGRSSSGPRPST